MTPDAPDREPLARPPHSLWVALQFLTRIPMPRDLNPTSEDLGRSAAWFPVVGLVVGGLIALVAGVALAAGLTPGVAAVLAVTSGALITGGFHEDALADTADGFGGGYTRERRLEIMRDSRVGSFAVIALTALFAARLAALWSMTTTAWTGSLVTAHVAGRWSSVGLLRREPYARGDDGPGFGKPFVDNLSDRTVLFATLSALGIVALATGAAGIGAIALAWLAARYWAPYCRRRIGGQTGDTLGALNVVIEVVVLIAFSALSTTPHSPWIAP